MQNRFVLHFNLNRMMVSIIGTKDPPLHARMKKELWNKDNLNKSMRKSYFDGSENTAHIAVSMLTALLLLLLVVAVVFQFARLRTDKHKHISMAEFSVEVLMNKVLYTQTPMR